MLAPVGCLDREAEEYHGVGVDEEFVLQHQRQSRELGMKSPWTIRNVLGVESFGRVGSVSGVLWRCCLALGEKQRRASVGLWPRCHDDIHHTFGVS